LKTNFSCEMLKNREIPIQFSESSMKPTSAYPFEKIALFIIKAGHTRGDFDTRAKGIVVGLLLSGRDARHDNARYFYRPAGLRTIINIAVRLNNKSRHEIAAESRADRGGWLKVLFFPRSSLYNMKSCLPACLARSRGLRSSNFYF